MEPVAPPPWARPPGDGRPPIRTIGPQRGRLLPGQQQAYEELSARFVVELATLVDRAPFVLDVGPGDGASTIALATADPGVLHVSVDVHRPGILRLLRRLAQGGIDNVVVVEGDVWDVLVRVPAGSLSAVQCFFPDPWPKTRHHRRRLVTAGFVARCADALSAGGELRLATDWLPYAEQMRAAVLGSASFGFVEGPDGWSPRHEGRPVTTYERRGLAAGRPPRDVRAVRI